MTPQRWLEIEGLYHAALDREPAARAAFLEEADPELRREVESLLAQSGTLPAIDQETRAQLAAGARLGPYRIDGILGTGGMGSVYRAHDTRLRRDVALKVSQERFGERFEREARAVASLNHPNICALYDIGPNYLVMELVEGKSPKGPLPLAVALDYARQIAAALEAAHDKGIVHRDLKPGNIMIRADGAVKLLDFGLATAIHEPSAAEESSMLSTQTMPMTQAGMVLGTAAYMSPEQAQGLPVDKRTDIWAFGAVMYELLTGMRPFQGSTLTETLASVLKEEPDWDRVPKQAQRLLRRCLMKDPARRLRDIGDAMDLVSDDLSQVPAPRQAWRWWIAAGVAAAALTVGLAGGRWLSRTPDPETWSGAILGGPEIAFDPRISPNGNLLAFQAMEQGQTQAAVMTPESGNWSVLTHNRERGFLNEIAWSRDSTTLYYDRIADVPKGIFSIPVLGGEEKLVVENAMAPEVLPDGTLLIYKLNAQGALQLNRYWPETGRLQDLPVICRVGLAALSTHIRASPDGKEAVVFGTPLGHDAEPDRLLAVEVNTGASRPLTPPELPLASTAAVITRDGKSVLTAMRDDALDRVVSFPLSGKFTPRTLFTSTSHIQYLDTGADGKVYLSMIHGTAELLRFSPSANRTEVIAGLSANDGEVSVLLPDGRAVVPIRGLNRDRLMVVAEGKNPVPLLVTGEETSFPMAPVGPRGIAVMIGPAPHATIAVGDTASGRVVSKIAPGKGEISAIESSPDGKTLYFSAGGKIWSVPSAGGETVPIRAGDNVAADPDGRSLVIGTSESGKIKLFRVPLDGGKEREIATDGSVPMAPSGSNPGALRADGRMLVPLLPLDSWYLIPGILDPKTGRLTRLPPGQLTNASSLNWTSDGQIVGISRLPISGLWRFQPAGTRQQ